MGVSVERLYALWGLLALVPMIVLGEVRYRVIVKSCAAFSSFQKEGFYAMRRFMLCIRLRSFCFAFAWCMLVFAYAGISAKLVNFVVNMNLSPAMFCLLVAIILLIFGTFLEGIATAVLLVPVLWPIAQALGINVIHFGMIVSIANVVGTMTPPVAVNIFSAASVTKLPMGKIVHGQWPFFIGYVGFFFLVVLIPKLSLFLL